MSDEAMERDAELGALLRDACDAPVPEDGPEDGVDWPALQRSIAARAEPLLARRRMPPRRSPLRRTRVYVPATLAASLALFILVGRGGGPGHDAPAADANAEGISIEEMFDVDVTDGQFRALLAGAAELEDLLLIAATGSAIQ